DPGQVHDDVRAREDGRKTAGGDIGEAPLDPGSLGAARTAGEADDLVDRRITRERRDDAPSHIPRCSHHDDAHVVGVPASAAAANTKVAAARRGGYPRQATDEGVSGYDLIIAAEERSSPRRRGSSRTPERTSTPSASTSRIPPVSRSSTSTSPATAGRSRP